MGWDFLIFYFNGDFFNGIGHENCMKTIQNPIGIFRGPGFMGRFMGSFLMRKHIHALTELYALV